MKPTRQRGWSMTEALIALAVLGIVAASTMPSFVQMREVHSMRSAFDAFRSDLQLAQFEAVKRNAQVSLAVRASDSCWGIGTSPCDCTATSAAPNACDIKRSTLQDLSGISIGSVSFGGTSDVVFEPVRGMATAGSLVLASPSGRRVRVSVSPLGAVDSCTVAGTARIDRMKVCP